MRDDIRSPQRGLRPAWAKPGTAIGRLFLALGLILGQPLTSVAAQSEGLPTELDLPPGLMAEFEDEPEVYDPLEPLNRGMFWFNDKAYFYFLKPIARAYRVVPEPARESVDNFFDNLAAPVRMVNSVLQGKMESALIEFGRFMTNTTVGIGGLFDPARKYAGLRKQDEDFGQTLGAWGVGPGPYLVLPFLGPSSLRDGAGLIVDWQAHLGNYLFEGGEVWVAAGVRSVNTLSLDRDTYEAIKRDALDPYLFLREAYMQNRAGEIKR